MITLMSVNALDLYRETGPEQQQRYAGLAELVTRYQPDIVAIQEIITAGDTRADKAPGAEAGLRRWAEAVGMNYDAAGEPLLAVGGVWHHLGITYRDTCRRNPGTLIRPQPGTVRRLEREGAGMWHGAVAAIFDIGGHRMRIGTTHLGPFDQLWNQQNALQLLREYHRDQTPGLLGGDMNCTAADPDYDPDPYDGYPWHPDHVHQLDEYGHVDRQASIRLERIGRMKDCARLAGAPYTTTGHHPNDNHPPRRIDRWHTTHNFPTAAVTGFRVVPVADIGLLSDHRPVLVDIDETLLPVG
ncbi:MAG: hypothetical protein J2P17_22565 [Mycobacterium sp.]|nr:hypothetical protein [Mycobacterium sp.]